MTLGQENISMLETVLKAIDDLLSIIDRYKIKNVHPQVEDLKYLK